MPRECLIALGLTHAYSYYRDILRGLAQFAENRPHWRFVSCAPRVGRATQESLKDAEAIITGVHSREYCDFLLKSGVPIVNVDTLVADLPIPYINVDNQMVGRKAADHFLERGLRSFAFVGHPHFLFSTQREQAFRTALTASGYSLQVYESNSRHDFLEGVLSLDVSVSAWLQALPRPTGILLPNDLWAVELMMVCHRMGLRVPEDIAVLGVDNDDLFCSIARPALSSVSIPGVAVGKQAGAVVEGILEGSLSGLTETILIPPGEIAVRRSTDVLAIENQDVVAAIRFIRENAHRPLQVADVLKEIPVSRRWLERCVYDALGISLGAEIRRTRLERAKRLLDETDLSIAEIAIRSGYSDWRHIEASFRKEIGCTPTQFRRRRGGDSSI